MEGGVHGAYVITQIDFNVLIQGVGSILSLLSAVKVFGEIGETVGVRSHFSLSGWRTIGRYINGGFIHVPRSRVE